MNECDQGKYMDLGVTTASQDEVDEIGVSRHVPESEPAWILPSSSTNSLLGLPEMTLQPSISSEVELLDEFAEQPHQEEKKKSRDVEQEDAQSEADTSRFCQKDRASILEDAANYVKSLKLQMMKKAREGEFLAQYMPCVATPGMQFSSVPQSVPIRPGIGAGVGMAFRPSVCASCSTPCAQWMPFPPAAGVHPFAPSTLASFPFPTMCPTPVLPTEGNSAGETEQPETGKPSGRRATKQHNS
uniref:Uncharacterized protein n=1 Tax=Chenopodium quinoa TaxID=63459 RepID=A0A803KUV5_CHEQI